jgi:hypothetical protein
LRFDTKIAFVLDDDLAGWQKANVTAFLASGIAATVPDIVGRPYADGSGQEYLPMFRQPVMVYAADAEGIRRAYRRALERDVTLAIYTRELFSTGHDAANRAAVAAVPADDLDLVGIAMHADGKVVDRVLDKIRPHP